MVFEFGVKRLPASLALLLRHLMRLPAIVIRLLLVDLRAFEVLDLWKLHVDSAERVQCDPIHVPIKLLFEILLDQL